MILYHYSARPFLERSNRNQRLKKMTVLSHSIIVHNFILFSFQFHSLTDDVCFWQGTSNAPRQANYLDDKKAQKAGIYFQTVVRKKVDMVAGNVTHQNLG